LTRMDAERTESMRLHFGGASGVDEDKIPNSMVNMAVVKFWVIIGLLPGLQNELDSVDEFISREEFFALTERCQKIVQRQRTREEFVNEDLLPIGRTPGTRTGGQHGNFPRGIGGHVDT